MSEKALILNKRILSTGTSNFYPGTLTLAFDLFMKILTLLITTDSECCSSGISHEYFYVGANIFLHCDLDLRV